jgi:release factor glutamine methyltransferase
MTTKLNDWRLKAIQTLSPFSEDAVIEVNAILKNQLKKDLTWIILNPDSIISPNNLDKLEKDLEKLKQKIPLAYILGFQEFYGINFIVSPDVLIPRPETELLVENAIQWGRLINHSFRLLDVGTGSGCIALSILKNLPNCFGYGVDISYRALSIAKENAHNLKVPNINFINADLTMFLIGKFDMICANLPYIPISVIQSIPHSRFEPLIALNGGDKGVEIIRSLLEQLKEKINTPGIILLEIQNDQGKDVVDYASLQFPKANISILEDYSSQPRIVKIVFN